MSDSNILFNNSQQELDFERYVDYTYIDGVTITFSSINEFIEGFRNEIEKSSNTVTFIHFDDNGIQSDAFRLTNLLSEVGSKLTRAYNILRTVKTYRDKLISQWDDITNKELSDGVSGKTKEIRQATLANKYKMVYNSIQVLNRFIDDEVTEYINEMTIAKEILSRQISSLEIEVKLASI